MNRRIFIGLLVALPFVGWFRGPDRPAMYTLPAEYLIPGPYKDLDRAGWHAFYEGDRWEGLIRHEGEMFYLQERPLIGPNTTYRIADGKFITENDGIIQKNKIIKRIKEERNVKS